MPYREKKYICGNLAEAEIYPISAEEKKKSRKRKKKESTIVQKNLNDKNSRKHLTRLMNLNFTDRDIVVHLTFTDAILPKTEEEAKKILQNYIRRVRHYRKKNKLPPLKYIAVFEYETEEEGKKKKAVRMHFHIVMNGGIDRDILEKFWGRGRANADRLQADLKGYEDLANYLTKAPRGNKRWIQSKNLKMPVPDINDCKYSKRKVENLAKSPDVKEHFEQDFKKIYGEEFIFISCEPTWNEEFGYWALYIKLRRKNNYAHEGSAGRGKDYEDHEGEAV